MSLAEPKIKLANVIPSGRYATSLVELAISWMRNMQIYIVHNVKTSSAFNPIQKKMKRKCGVGMKKREKFKETFEVEICFERMKNHKFCGNEMCFYSK